MFKRRYIALSMLLLFPLLINVVYADIQDVDLTQIPQRLAERIGIPVFASQLLCSALLFLMFILPIRIMIKGRIDPLLPEMVVTFVLLGFLYTLEWLPLWFVLVIALISALMYGDRLKHKEKPSY